MKWYFDALMAVSAALMQWFCGSTSWIFAPSFLIWALIAWKHSLSKTQSLGLLLYYYWDSTNTVAAQSGRTQRTDSRTHARTRAR